MTRTAWLLSSIALVMMGCSAYGESAYTGRETPGTGTPDVALEPGMGTSLPGTGTAEPGTLTAGVWDDNRNLAHFEKFLSEMNADEAAYQPNFSEAERAGAAEIFAGERASNTQLDVALVIDTTGSMADEMSYLSAEFMAIATEINALYPGAATRWALVVYKDEGDEYVVRTFDFTADAATFRTNLAAQSADGGGDYPEASHAALAAATNLAWREEDSVARLAFWVADAPHHAAVTAELAAAVRTARDLDVHLYPVASSGVDRATEASMRASAQLTGGRYVFLTNDSGVGGDHLEPSIPCYFVTLLADAIIRMVDIEMSGEYHEPAEAEVIRTGGEPSHGACTLESGDQVLIF